VPAELANRGADLGKLGCGLEVHAPSTGVARGVWWRSMGFVRIANV
jgi:hypothetical protein